MKLRNKKSGKIAELFGIACQGSRTFLQFHDNYRNFKFECESLTDLNEEWEDVEVPKKYWFIDEYGMVQQEIDYYYDENKSAVHDKRLEIGNYFETKEEAEKAVEKLKAFKRLRDNGFKFEGLEKRGRCIKFYQGRSYETEEQCIQAGIDLDLLFSNEITNLKPRRLFK